MRPKTSKPAVAEAVASFGWPPRSVRREGKHVLQEGLTIASRRENASEDGGFPRLFAWQKHRHGERSSRIALTPADFCSVEHKSTGKGCQEREWERTEERGRQVQCPNPKSQ